MSPVTAVPSISKQPGSQFGRGHETRLQLEMNKELDLVKSYQIARLMTQILFIVLELEPCCTATVPTIDDDHY